MKPEDPILESMEGDRGGVVEWGAGVHSLPHRRFSWELQPGLKWFSLIVFLVSPFESQVPDCNLSLTCSPNRKLVVCCH